METRRLGAHGPELSVVGLGCNNFGMAIDRDASVAVVHAALDAGITHFDTAEMYGGGRSEEYLGEALGGRRDEVTIATKFVPRPKDEPYEPGRLRRRIQESCEIALRRLKSDRIDLFYQHYPDHDGPVDEALETLDELVRAGKVAHVASSNVSAQQIDSAAAVAAARDLTAFSGTQIHWNLLNREVEVDVVPAARRHQLGIVPFFPLASGMLTGKYLRDQPFPEGSRLARLPHFAASTNGETFDRVEALTAFATERDHTILELAFAWLVAQDGVTSVIAGATTPEQVRANASAGSWRLSTDDLAAVPS